MKIAHILGIYRYIWNDRITKCILNSLSWNKKRLVITFFLKVASILHFLIAHGGSSLWNTCYRMSRLELFVRWGNQIQIRTSGILLGDTEDKLLQGQTSSQIKYPVSIHQDLELVASRAAEFFADISSKYLRDLRGEHFRNRALMLWRHRPRLGKHSLSYIAW